MKSFVAFLVLVFWLSSWFPVSFNNWAIAASAVCFLGFTLAFLCSKKLKAQSWISKTISAVSILVLIIGALLAFAQSALLSSAQGAITFFFVLGGAGYLSMIAGILTPNAALRKLPNIGALVLLSVASWSWLSALGMYFHRGAIGATSEACILTPNAARYDAELVSILSMRLPEVAATRTAPTGDAILDYHAILVAPPHEETQIYNWSKTSMRFHIVDKTRNPNLPILCP